MPSSPPSLPLSDDDVAELRSRLAAGETPTVCVLSASAAVAAGTRGKVLRLGDPATSEYVVVRLGRDEVPFAPNELGMTGRRPKVPPTPAAASTEATPPLTPPSPPTHQSSPPTTRAGQRRTGARLSVTLEFERGEWTARAQSGSRRPTKPVPIRPGAVGALAEHLDEPLRALVAAAVDEARDAVAAHADQLRAQLAAAEAALADYDPRPQRNPRRR